MTTRKRVTPWHTFSILQGNAIQVVGLLGAATLAWYAGREEARGEGGGGRWMVASRLLAYFSEHAFCHWLVGRALGIRFTGYGLHGTSHPQLYPPGARWVFSHLPLLSARVDPASLKAASPAARAAMYSAGTVGTVLVGLTIPAYAKWRGISGAGGLLVADVEGDGAEVAREGWGLLEPAPASEAEPADQEQGRAVSLYVVVYAGVVSEHHGHDANLLGRCAYLLQAKHRSLV